MAGIFKRVAWADLAVRQEMRGLTLGARISNALLLHRVQWTVTSAKKGVSAPPKRSAQMGRVVWACGVEAPLL